MARLLLTLCTLLAVSTALARVPYHVLFGFCYDFQIPNDFSPKKFLEGQWFEIARFDNSFEEKAICTNVTFYVESPTKWNMAFSAFNADNSTSLVIGDIAFNITNSPIQMKARFPEDSTWSSFVIIDSDYDNFGIVYSCWQFSNDPSLPEKQERLWILGRNPVLSEDVTDLVAGALNGTDLARYLLNTDQICYL